MSTSTGLPLIKAFNTDFFPLDRLDPSSDLGQFLSNILVTEYTDEMFDPGPGGRFEMGLTVADEAVLNLVGLEGFALVFGGASSTTIRFGMSIKISGWEVKLGAGARLRFPRNILKPVRKDGNQWVDDPSRAYAELDISAGIIVDQDWNVTFDGSNAFHLASAMVADSGLVIEGDVALDLSETTGLPESAALGLPPTWRGVVFKSLNLYLPDAVTQAVPIASLSFTNFHIGTGGVTGSISLNGTPDDGSIGGFPFRPTLLVVELRQNCLVRAEIEGQLTLSFFDEPLDVTAGFDLDGNFTVAVAATSGLVNLEKPGILSLTVDGISFALHDSVFTVAIAGTLTPLIGGLDWPGFRVQELSIDSEGHVRLEGGWLNLPDQYSLDFYGFHVGITRLGMGSTDDGGKWIGFSGNIKLVDGLSIGGSVDGLRVAWYNDGRPPKLTLEGVGVELEIPETLRFKGSVSYHELPGPQRRFDGDITLELIALDLRIDGKIVVGVDTNPATGVQYTFFALYIGVELPAGIPLWSTGLGLYGIAGLVAIQMAPNKGAAPNVLHPASRPDEEWFENLDGSPGWYKRDVIGVTDLRSKWDAVLDGFALGGGVTIGTVADNGFTFSGSLLLVISFPGPIILLEGKANLLKERSKLTDNPIFRALVVLDFRAGNFLVGLDARYKFGDDGELIEIAGSAEAFFDFNDASRWHLYLGQKDPKAKRIRAQILSLFEANSYFMLEALQLQMGAWVGYDKQWTFGPLGVVVEAWIEGGVVVSWKPVYFHGDLWLHGKAELRVFGFGFGLHVDARFAADVFDPFHLLAQFSVGISLPWPLPDFEVDITLEWGPTPEQPPLPVPLKEIAIEHFKSTASWPLPRADLLLPNVDGGNGFIALPIPAADTAAGPPANTPVVPMDARPHLTFGRAVHDDGLVGVNPQPVWPSASPPGWERIGDPDANQGPMRVRFGLKEVVLARWNGAIWIDVARKAATANPSGVKKLFGSWAPIPQLPSGIVAPGTDPPVAQVKLWLWSKTPFDYSRHGGRAWDEWFTDTFTTYPCIPPVPERTICCDFDDIPVGSPIQLPMPCRHHPEILFVGNVWGIVEPLASPSHGHTHALCWEGGKQSTDVRGVLRTNTMVADRGAFGIVLIGEPARQMTLVLAGETSRTVRRCFVLDTIEGERLKIPFEQSGSVLRVFDREGHEINESNLHTVGGRRGVNIDHHAEITLPCETRSVDVSVWQSATAVTVSGYDVGGSLVASAHAPDTSGLVTVHLSGLAITRVVIDAPQNETVLIEVCSECAVTGPPEVQVVAVDTDGNQSGPYLPVGDTVTVDVTKLRGVIVYAREHVCLVQVCLTYPPSADEVAARQDMAKRLADSMALWGDEGEVLSANTAYRIKVVTTVEGVGEGALAGVSHTHELTELAYFKTEGPPALATLSPPVHHPPGEAFDSGLDDLTRYVRQTVPPTVPASGQQPLLPRPVYRAYDVGAVFNEDYVDLMYRLSRCDLCLYLYNANNQPVRDVIGRLIVSSNLWGVTESVTLTESEVRYLSVIDQSTCVSAEPTIIPHQVTLFAIDPGLVLDPDMVYEARLMPLLLHEDFRDALGAWTVVDSGTNQGPSNWATPGHPTLEGAGATALGPVVTLAGASDLSRIDPATDVVILSTDTARATKTYRIVSVDNTTKKVTVDGNPALASGSSAWELPGWGTVTQSSNIWGGDDRATGIPKPGTMLVTGDGTWTDYRYSVQVRSSDDDAIGVVFRYHGPGDHYRFSMDRERRYRRLVRVIGGAYTLLAEDDFVYTTDQDYVITVEAIGASIRVYQDGALVFDVDDGALADGQIGLYCWANVGARFSDVRVDDVRQGAPIAYRFSFTTSNYVDFFHHLHSFQDETWVTEAKDGALGGEIAAAVALSGITPGSTVGDGESRAFSTLAGKVLGAVTQKAAETVEVHRVTVDSNAVGLLLRSPEPIDWRRTTLTLSRAEGLVAASAVPGLAKLTDVAAGGGAPNDEVVTVLARERMSPAGASIETYGIPGPLRDTTEDLLLDDNFNRPGGVLFEELFGSNALDGYRIVDATGAVSGPSHWAISAGAIVQSSNIYAGLFFGTDAARLGTMAITGRRWADIRLTAVLRSSDDDAIGVVFRYNDDRNWYRFSMDRQRPYRRLVKCVDAVVTVLWEDNVVYDMGSAYEVRIDAYGDLLLGYVDHTLLFIVHDGDIRDGQVGLYCWANIGARFEALRVESLDASPLLWQASFEDIGELSVVDTGIHAGPSVWGAAAGVVTQTSNIWGDSPAPGISRPGTVGLLQRSFTDLELSVRLTSNDDDAIGVLFRYQDADNWYRFSMDRQRNYRRLVRCVGGVHMVLWQDAVAYEQGHTYTLTIIAEGSRLRGWLDGAALFDVTDEGLHTGRIGLYCWANVGARFERLVVTDPVRRIGTWRIVDNSTVAGPSSWRASNGSQRQIANIGGPALPDALGTVALAGNSDWSDYRIEVHARSDDDGAIGVVFRYQDPAHWYRLSLDAQRSYRRLVKYVDGAITVLWQDAGSYTVGQPFTLLVDAIGDRIVGRHGDQTLFDLVDADHPTGLVGLYCWANVGARFERVTVTLPPLDAYAIFRDRFAAGDLAAWTVVDEGAQSAPSAWAIAAGELRQTSNIYSDPIAGAAIEKRGTQALAGNAAWDDVVLSVRLRSDDDDAIGVLFRYQDASNFYRFSMDRERGYRRLVRCAAGVFTTLWEDGVAYEVGRSYSLVVAALGARINAWIDGVPLLEVEDGTVGHGRIGLYCWANTGARFSNVRVFRPDRLWSTYLLSDDFDLDMPGRWSYVTAGDQQGPAVWEIAGGMLHQTSNVWGGVDDALELAKPGTIALFDQPAELREIGLVPGSESWSDYRLTVRLRSDDDDAIGVVFRYRDQDSWYRFSMDRERTYRRLVRCVGGVVAELWHDAVPYVQGREYLLTIDAIGDALVGYLDGVELFSVRDNDLTSGTIGLYCWANMDARFSSVRVTAAGWSTHYRFGPDEEVLAAGTRIAVHSGNAVDWTAPPTPGLVHRFLATVQDYGRRHLPTNRPVALRWRNAISEIGHARRFLPGDAYSAVSSARVLRNADSAEVAIFVPVADSPGSALMEGQYRLQFTYRRDNTAADPESTILSRAGDRSNEVITLDVPWSIQE